MDADELITVYTVYDPAEADVIRNALEMEGIRCVLDNEHQAGLTGVFQIAVQVRAIDADKARRLIESGEGER